MSTCICACKGTGWLVMFQTSTYQIVIERCDSCEIFTDDQEAGGAFLTWLKEQGVTLPQYEK